MLQKQFNEYKAEFSFVGTTAERKKELIALMQANLRDRCGNVGKTFVCLDGKEHSLGSDNVEDLYAIDGFFKFIKVHK